jgi:hypothetical protein
MRTILSGQKQISFGLPKLSAPPQLVSIANSARPRITSVSIINEAK